MVKCIISIYQPSDSIEPDDQSIDNLYDLVRRLIDQIGDLDDAVKKAIELGAAPGATVVEYRAIESLSRYLRLFGKADSSKKVEINLGPQSALHLQPGRLYLLPEILAP